MGHGVANIHIDFGFAPVMAISTAALDHHFTLTASPNVPRTNFAFGALASSRKEGTQGILEGNLGALGHHCED
jgi:hypothetical protein